MGIGNKRLDNNLKNTQKVFSFKMCKKSKLIFLNESWCFQVTLYYDNFSPNLLNPLKTKQTNKLCFILKINLYLSKELAISIWFGVWDLILKNQKMSSVVNILVYFKYSWRAFSCLNCIVNRMCYFVSSTDL